MPLIAILHVHVHHFHGPAIDYLGLALVAGASWVGVPGPGEPVLIAAGVFAARHKLDITEVLVMAWLGATVGGVAGWLIGLKAGRRLVTGRGPLRRLRLNAVARGETVFARYPVVAIALTPSWVAGIHRVGAVMFLPVNAIGAGLWAAGIGLGAYYVGPTVVDFVDDLGLVTGAAVLALVVIVVSAEVVRRIRKGRQVDPAGPEPAAQDR